MEKTKTTTVIPLGGYVLIENPLKRGLVDEIMQKAEQLPPKEREEYVKKYHREIFENIQVIEIGPDVPKGVLKPGDIVVTTPELLNRAYPIEAEDFLVVSYTSFFGKKLQ